MNKSKHVLNSHGLRLRKRQEKTWMKLCHLHSFQIYLDRNQMDS